MIQLEPREYIEFTVYHPSSPDKKITVFTFEKRGAQLRAKRILVRLGIMKEEEHWKDLKVE